MEIAKKIVQTANSFLGQEEIRGNLGFKDKTFEEYMAAVGWKKKQAWCSYFVELVWKLAFVHDQNLIRELNRLFSASAVETWVFFLSSDWITSNIPSEGSLAVWQKYKKGVSHWSGHIGIVISHDDKHFTTIEGNTNDDGSREGYEVAEKHRKYSWKVNNGLRLLGFIHPEKKDSGI